jgi:hypothetical protein
VLLSNGSRPIQSYTVTRCLRQEEHELSMTKTPASIQKVMNSGYAAAYCCTYLRNSSNQSS